MPKVTGPLFSIDAKGKFGKGALVFSGNGQTKYCRKIAVPSGKPSEKQQAQRDRFAYIQALWRDLPVRYKEEWENCPYSIAEANAGKAMKAAVKGKELFMRSASRFISLGLPVYASPYHRGTATLINRGRLAAGGMVINPERGD